jgi:hypothetical protein
MAIGQIGRRIRSKAPAVRWAVCVTIYDWYNKCHIPIISVVLPGEYWRIRWCRNPEPAWGGSMCLQSDGVTYAEVEERWDSCVCT